jgi:pimeloyl-ACP methyl ester carboxylesterase
MANDNVETFLRCATAERFEMALDETVADDLRSYLGTAAYDELRSIARQTLAAKTGHLGINIPPNIIFVPGVMGSLLFSRKKGGVWWVDARTRTHINDLRLSPDGATDAQAENGVEPFTVDTTYEPFFAAVLRREDFNHEIFAYDWRKPLTASADALRDKLLEVYTNNGNDPVHLVAHSMGGLMVRAALMKHGDELWPKIGRIIFLGTPHYGSPAIAGYLKNHLWGFDLMAIMGIYLSRDTLRSLWGVIGMLPAPRGIYPGTRSDDASVWAGGDASDTYVHPTANFDMYDAKAWQLDLSAEQVGQLQKVLDGAAQFHSDLYESHRRLRHDQRDRMAVIAGVGYKTLFRLAYQKHLWGLWESADKVTQRIPNDPHRDGDGRVPVASAALEDVGEIRYVQGVHGELPMIPEVYNDVFRWLNKERMELYDTPAAALASHLGAGDESVEAPNLTRTTTVDEITGDPGFWNLNPPDPSQLELIEARLNAEQLPDFNRIRLL